MGKLNDLTMLVGEMFAKATEPEDIKKLALGQQLAKEAMAEEQELLTKHQALKKDYAEAVKFTVVTDKLPEQAKVKTPKEIVAELHLEKKFPHTNDHY